MNYTIRTECRACKTWLPTQRPLEPFADLGEQPLADQFLIRPQDKQEAYPLQVGFCPNCKLVQHQVIVDDTILFGSDYGFFTGASPSSIPYFKQYADDVKRAFPDQSHGFVVEIASNDGTLLRHFVADSREVLGIEPTENTARVAIEQGVETMVEYFGLNTAMKVTRAYGKADLIMANNVLAHTDKLIDFVGGINHLLDPEGVAVIEVQYFPHLLYNNAFDHLYHEHRSFFSLTSLKSVLAVHNLEIFDVLEADTQGGSIRVFVQHTATGKQAVLHEVERLLDYEKTLGLLENDAYRSFMTRVRYQNMKLRSLLERLKKQGKTVYGFGASAKGNTLLNTLRIKQDLVPYIVDLTDWKIGKYAPGSKIPIVRPEDVPPPDYYLLLVWNYLDGVLEREKAFKEKGGKWIIPIPSVIVI